VADPIFNYAIDPTLPKMLFFEADICFN